MLVLSRRKAEAVVFTIPPSPIERQVRLVVVDNNGHAAKLGIAAPKEIGVVRAELVEGETVNG